MTYFSDLLTTRANPFEIDVELEVRKIFEKQTDYTFEFQKNENKYDYDISVFKYYINGSDWKKKLIAFIELEISESWKNEYPLYWKYYSFLKRKVFRYNYETNQYVKQLKENGEQTIYIIFNKTLTDAVCCDISTIATFSEQHVTVTNNIRQDTYLREPLTSNRVTRGLSNSISKIKEFIKSKS